MKNQYKVISILAGIMLSEGVFAEPSVGELYSRESSKSKPSTPPTYPVWKPERQLLTQPKKSGGLITGEKSSSKPSMPSTDIPNINKKAESIKKGDFVGVNRQHLATSLVVTDKKQQLPGTIIDNTINTSKTTLDVPGLLGAITEAEEVANYIKDIHSNVTNISSKISVQKNNVKQLLSNLNNLTQKIDNAKGTISTKSTSEALDVVSRQINSYEVESSKIILKVTEIDSKVSSLNNELKTAKDVSSNVEKFTKALKIADYAGKALTVASMLNESTKLNERVASGSSFEAEVLTIVLSGVESFQPTLPFTHPPSDIARAMIDLTGDLKEKNASLVNFNLSLANNVNQLVSGGSNFDAFLAKNLSGLSFSEAKFNEELLDSYESLKSSYLSNYDNIIAQAENQKNIVKELHDNAWLDDSKDMYKSLLDGIEMQLTALKNERIAIANNKGYSVLGEYANWYVQNQVVNISKELDIESKNLSSEVNMLNNASSKIFSSKLNTTEYNLQTNEKETIEKASREKKNKLTTKSIDIKEKEIDLVNKQKELDDKKKELANTNKYINNYSENTQTSYDQKKLAYLQAAQNLFNKYGNKPIPDWSENDRKKLDLLAKNIGTTEGHLFAELRLGHFNSLRDKYASTSTVSSSVETIENLDYKNIEGQISALTDDIKTLNQGLTLDKMQQADLKMSVNNLNNSINDVNNGNKVRVTESNSTPPHENWWHGHYTKNYYSENNLGEPVINGWGDGPAETQASKPGIGTVLYLDNTGDPQGINRKIALKNSASEYFGDYNYVAWGTWSDPNAVNKIYISHWVVVNQLDREQVPHTGTATYKGELNGILFNIGQANTIHNANGDITMDTDFAKNSINGTLNVRNADNRDAFATAKFDTKMSSTADGDGLKFQGALTGDNISNHPEWHSQISGEFGGNQAAEAGGVWSITKGTGSVGDGRATGVFRAEKQ